MRRGSGQLGSLENERLEVREVRGPLAVPVGAYLRVCPLPTRADTHVRPYVSAADAPLV